LTEAAALQGAAQDYMVVPAPVSGAFHAKVWIIVGEVEALVLTGSGNLTQAGFMTNAEFFDVLHLTKGELSSPELVADIRRFINGLIGIWPSEDGDQLLCIETLREIEQAIACFPVAAVQSEKTPRFLHSFRGPLIDQLPQIPDARELYVAAPFFGGSLRGLQIFTDRYPKAKLHLFPAVHSGRVRTTDIPLNQVRKSQNAAQILPLTVPGKNSAFAHLKLYGVAGDEETAWLCCTSANCTHAAWIGPNIEAGVLRAVSPSLVAGYFSPGTATLPEGHLKTEPRRDATGTLQCWATDSGAGLDLLVAKDSRSHLPLRDVTMTARVGSSFATCQKSTLYNESCFTHLPWTAFAGWERRRRVAISLELHAIDVAGRPVRADCFVENKLLLRADPLHRSAWRGALALLDAEGAPELADVAAIFALANDLFVGTSIRLPVPDSVGGVPKKDEEKTMPVAVAIWPPRPDTRELGQKIGTAALGQLQWFQHILKTFLSNTAAKDGDHQPDFGHVIHGGDDEEGDERGTRRRDDDKPVTKTVQRIWDLATNDYARIREKLTELCPTADNAPNIWPASVFALLSTLAVLRFARRMAPDIISEKETEFLCDDFLRAMLSERKQDDDFCCPAGFRYRCERFPPLAEDLQKAFSIRPHTDLANVILSLIVDKRMRGSVSAGSTSWQKRHVALICGQPFLADADTREACRCVWQKYVRDVSRRETDAEFESCFDSICAGQPEAAS
jgi:hypothetical protein